LNSRRKASETLKLSGIPPPSPFTGEICRDAFLDGVVAFADLPAAMLRLGISGTGIAVPLTATRSADNVAAGCLLIDFLSF
jgi:hypothetical protein